MSQAPNNNSEAQSGPANDGAELSWREKARLKGRTPLPSPPNQHPAPAPRSEDDSETVADSSHHSSPAGPSQVPEVPSDYDWEDEQPQASTSAQPAQPDGEPSAAAPAAEKPRIPCPKCGKTFANRSSMGQHYRFEHGMPCKWPGCGQRVKTFAKELENHLIEHSQDAASASDPENPPFLVCQWPGCGAHLPGQKELGRHLYSHNDKVFKEEGDDV
ncbi:hypothetical protein M426DRAFT_21281 [Hypoxylon sp. CI-4A]|nr:hypothetical protein M426DRAFT_21281 [Hypoxylon sp. CI-4A]